MKGFDNFDEAYSNRTDDEGLPLSTRPLLRRKPHRERLIFWGANAVGMPLVALFALSLGAEGLKRTVGGFALKLYKLPIPGASRLEQYDGFARIDLAMVFAKHVVLKWETSIKQGNGKAIEPTNEAFCDLMTHQARELRFVFNQFRDDVADLANFRDQRDEEAEKN